ncbi:hypothetical protein K491DRAFT_711881 [Lophiostoma macrostomum CBS 122681]|uniref:BZIP domain-containing protein n=1 Tax=Lophiostoma macrostomum CBS 122681 TaxID=1314788 RepID=A0A6A6TK30_9PLEO|nr:hypothetical protein K491DRAFT_711881 [Lophiostoma macrostomum CBS 122681]
MEDNEQPDAELEVAERRPRPTGRGMGYGLWLDPFINDIDMDSSKSASRETSTEQLQDPRHSASASASASNSMEPSPGPETRRRGRPRVSAVRNDSAIEKRRAQVRNAQRTYQKRKDNAAQTVNQRCDELLETLSTLSTEVEEMLRVASKAGTLERRDDLGAQMRKLSSTYDAVINSACVTPELRLLQVKNHKRRAEHQSTESFRIDHPSEDSDSNATTPKAAPGGSASGGSALHIDPSTVDLSLVRGDGSTMIQSFRGLTSKNDAFRGRSIFDIVEERQAQFRNSNNASR